MGKSRKHAGGRPAEYTPEMGERICQRLVAGESVNAMCRDRDMPSSATVFNWLHRAELGEFLEKYNRARRAQADALFDEIPDIADDSSADRKLVTTADGKTAEVVDHEHISRARLRVDARFRWAAKVAPKKYGDRVDVGTPEDDPVSRFFASLGDTILRPRDDDEDVS